MARRRALEVVATRDGGWWTLHVPDVPGALSQARRLDHAEDAAREEAIALVLDMPEDEIEVRISPRLDDGADAAVAEARVRRARLDDARREAREATDRAVRALRERGLPLRDIGRLLGVGHQRAARLAAATGSAAQRLRTTSAMVRTLLPAADRGRMRTV